MDSLAIIFNFLGSWLLVAGPIYQAALELREQDIEEERFHAIASTITPPAPVSSWWWLIPPARLFLARKRTRQYRRTYFAALSAEDSKSLLVFFDKATAWLMVGLGGFLVALNDTYELTHHYEWRFGWYVVLVAGLLLGSILFTVRRMSRSGNIIELNAKKA